MRRWIPALVLAFCGILIYFAMMHQSVGDPGSGMSADKLCRNLLQKKTHAEALTWLNQSRANDVRTVGEQGPEDSLKIVKGLYQAGAVEVQAVDLDRVSGVGETVNTLCVELPGDPEKRTRLLRIEARVARGGGFDRVPDEGQQYMFLHRLKLTYLP
jgi:hypothetical protein